MERPIRALLIALTIAGLPFLFYVAGCGGSGGTPPPPPVHNEWAWMDGANTADQPGIYGTQGVPSASNSPGARLWSCSWTDRSGNFWLFGGLGWASTIAQTDFNDLWEYSNGQWAWMGGLNQVTEQASPAQLAGIYGTMGVPAPANQPGARYLATSWTDPQGNLWLYGGQGFDSTGRNGLLDDLWRYSNGEWAWMNGSNIAAEPGLTGAWQGEAVFGTKGVAAPDNTPGVRTGASSWADSTGNLWLFGGLGEVSNGTSYGLGGNLNDVWKFAASTGEWTWMAGSNQIDQYGTYGTLGTPAPGNTPGTRSGAAAWTDASGNLWLFGGVGVGIPGDDCAGLSWCVLNDLWKFSPSLNEWTWMGGPDVSNQPGVYGTEGVDAPGNLPPPRENVVAWTDAEGNVWLFGGDFLIYDYNDLWKYSNGEWTWMSGAQNDACQAGVYGTLGTPAAANVPGARAGSVGWADTAGNLWLFGGAVFNCPGYPSTTKFNDLWKYQP
jgi:hypothetical protein